MNEALAMLYELLEQGHCVNYRMKEGVFICAISKRLTCANADGLIVEADGRTLEEAFKHAQSQLKSAEYFVLES